MMKRFFKNLQFLFYLLSILLKSLMTSKTKYDEITSKTSKEGGDPYDISGSGVPETSGNSKSEQGK